MGIATRRRDNTSDSDDLSKPNLQKFDMQGSLGRILPE
jgi:hypothetical protein